MEGTKDIADASKGSSVVTEVKVVPPTETKTDNTIVEEEIKNGSRTPPTVTDGGGGAELVTSGGVDATEKAKNEEEIEIDEKAELITHTKKLDDTEPKELCDTTKDAAPEDPTLNNDNELSRDLVKPEEDKEGEELDDDEVKTNPAYIPKGGLFYMHDTRSSVENELTAGDNAKKTRADGKWTHDLYNEKRQTPKSSRELEEVYGFDIRSDKKSRTSGASQNVRKDPSRKKEVERVPRSKPPGQFKRQSIARREEKGPEQQTRPRGPRTFKRSTLQNRKSHGENNSDSGLDTIEKKFNRLAVTNSSIKGKDDGGTNGCIRNYHQPDIRKRAPRYAAPVIPVGFIPVPVTLTGPSLGHAPALQSTFNARPRQPTDAVYFDPKTHVQGPPPQPRERKRLQFVPPQ